MNLWPLLIMNGILVVITILLAIAAKLLVDYGQCTITLRENDEEKTFTVQGGSTLLTNLIDNGVKISSSCAGKASCGYCKVQVAKGGGQILPTEEIFMTREEKSNGMRLACQVKVKEDVDIQIPDFLSIVRSIVANRSWDPSMRWAFNRRGITYPEERWLETRVSAEDREKIARLAAAHKDKKGMLIPLLQAVTAEYNYLPEPVLYHVAKELDVPLSSIMRIATFYNNFSLRPKGRHIIRVCMGTACYVKGGSKILDALKRTLGVDVDEATKDLKFSLETVSCLGCCGQAPVMTVDDDIYGYMNQTRIKKVLEKYE